MHSCARSSPPLSLLRPTRQNVASSSRLRRVDSRLCPQSLSLSTCATVVVKLAMAEFQKRWVTHLRNNARQEPSGPNYSCPLCAEAVLPDIEAFRAHVRADEHKHPTLTGDADIVEAFRKMAINTPSQRSVHLTFSTLRTCRLNLQIGKHFAQVHSCDETGRRQGPQDQWQWRTPEGFCPA